MRVARVNPCLGLRIAARAAGGRPHCDVSQTVLLTSTAVTSAFAPVLPLAPLTLLAVPAMLEVACLHLGHVADAACPAMAEPAFYFAVPMLRARAARSGAL